MFCNSLRQRPEYASIVTRLTQSSVLGLRGAELKGHDIALPLTTQPDPRSGREVPVRQLRFLLLSAIDVANKKLPATVQRIESLSRLSAGQDVAIVFTLVPPRNSGFPSAKQIAQTHGDDDDVQAKIGAMLAYARIQTELINLEEMPSIPVLPLTNLDGLPELLKKHKTAMTSQIFPKQTQKPPAVAARELLQLCTADPPMEDKTAHVLSDVFPDLRSLAEACIALDSPPSSSSPSARTAATNISSQYFQDPLQDSYFRSTQQWQYSYDSATANARAKLRQLQDLVGPERCAAVMEFWKTEYAPA